MEVLESLDTNSFLKCLRRFMAGRGQPRSITSDNGGNFVAANKELNRGLKQLNQDKIDDMLLQNGIAWKFLPPHSSHMVGVWERQIRSIRKVLISVLGSKDLLTKPL